MLAAALYIIKTQSGEQLALETEAETGAKAACGESSFHLTGKVREKLTPRVIIDMLCNQ